jgi:hypothetical protein
MLPYKSDGRRDAGCGCWKTDCVVGARSVYGSKDDTQIIALKDNCNVFRNAEIDIFLRDLIQRADLTH